MIDFEDTLSCGEIVPRLPYDRDDGELGIFPALAAAIPMVANLAGSLLSKKGEKGEASPEAASAQNVLDVLTKAVGADESKGELNLKDVITNIIKSVPPPVISQVKAGINELKNAAKAGEAKKAELVNAVDAKFGPQIHALLAGVKAQQLQRMATFEHNKLKSKSDFRKHTTKRLKSINAKLARIESRLAGAGLVRSDRVSVLGGRALLESR